MTGSLGCLEDAPLVDRAPDPDVLDLRRRDLRGIPLEHREVGAFTRFDGTNLTVEFQRISSAYRHRSQRLLNADALFSP